MKSATFALAMFAAMPALAQNVDNEALRLLGSCVYTNSQSIQSGQAVERQLIATQQYWKEYLDGLERQRNQDLTNPQK